MRNNLRVSCFLLSTALLTTTLTLCLTVEAAAFAPEYGPRPPDGQVAHGHKLTILPSSQFSRADAEHRVDLVDLDEKHTYIVQLADPALPTYEGGVRGIKATGTRGDPARKLDIQSHASVAYRDHLRREQSLLVSAIEKTLGRGPEVRFRYQLALNGMAVELTPREAAEVARLDSVTSVTRDWVERIQTDAGPAWVGAEEVWDGSAFDGPGTMGEGIIIGIIDTGINHDHPSFADVGGDGYDHVNPWGAGNYTGWCDPGNANYTTDVTCTDKLIGLWSFDDDLPEDYNGHGTHVASTAAGNVLTAALSAPTTDITRSIGGVAPHANLIGYSIEANPGAGTALGSSILAAAEQAIDDGVDVINYSFGGDPGDPWVLAQHWLNVRSAGIFVATAAGNSGPEPGTVGSPANAPWMLTVANATHNRQIVNSLEDLSPEGPSDIRGKGLTIGYGPAEIVYGGQCLTAFPPGTFDGEIVVCDRGSIGRVEKGENVLSGGAGGFVLANTVFDGESTVGDAHALPAVHIGAADAQVLKNWLDSGTVQTATISGYRLDEAQANGDIMAASSSRGPNIVPSILKPDVTAPGTDILAAVESQAGFPGAPPEYDFLSGTSMASPHAAGIGALVLALHPDWTPAEVQSAIMTAAVNQDGMLQEDGTTPASPFDRGSGRAYAAAAVQAGLLLDETADDFTNSNPSLGGNPTELNLASLADERCVRTCSWVRELNNSVPYTVTWDVVIAPTSEMSLSVRPAHFQLAPASSQVITVEADVTGLPSDGSYAFGGFTLEPTSALTEPARAFFPVGAKPSPILLPELVSVDAHRDAGSAPLENIDTGHLSGLIVHAYGMVSTDETFSVSEVPRLSFPAIFFQEGVYTTTVEVRPESPRLVAEILETTSPDLDMLVVFDSDGDGVPELSDVDERTCQSAWVGSLESCDIAAPTPGTWFVLVANYEASTRSSDDVTLAAVTVPSLDVGNLKLETLSGAQSAAKVQPLLAWNEPSLEPGDRWYGALGFGSGPGAGDDMGLVPVNITRKEDDVSKTVTPHGVISGTESVVTYTITIRNARPISVSYVITDQLPPESTFGGFTYDSGAVYTNGVVSWAGTLGPEALSVQVVEGDSPVGYLPLADLGTPPSVCTAACDEAMLDVSNLYPFYYLGESYTELSMVTNGYLIPGGGTEDDISPLNQSLPDPGRPNNTVAPLWTDLDLAPSGGQGAGTWYADQVTAGAGTGWVVAEWVGAQEWNRPGVTHSFQVWFDQYSDDVSMVYGAVDAGLNTGTVGAENSQGSLGDTTYFNGTGTAPTSTTELKIRGGLSPATRTIQFTATVSLTQSLTNSVSSSVDVPFSAVETHTAILQALTESVYLPLVVRGHAD